MLEVDNGSESEGPHATQVVKLGETSDQAKVDKNRRRGRGIAGDLSGSYSVGGSRVGKKE